MHLPPALEMSQAFVKQQEGGRAQAATAQMYNYVSVGKESKAGKLSQAWNVSGMMREIIWRPDAAAAKDMSPDCPDNVVQGNTEHLPLHPASQELLHSGASFIQSNYSHPSQ